MLNNITGILSTMFSMSIPLILAALGGVYSVRSGIMALGLESMILTGAFTAAVGSFYSGNAWIGLLCGILGGMIFGLCHGLLCIRYKVNQVISGIGLNLLATAASTLLMQIIWGNKGNSEAVASVNTKLTLLKDIPVLGDIFSRQSVLLIFTILVCIASWFILFKTPFGLRLRMVGENPKAASSMGIPVRRMKYIGVLVCGGAGRSGRGVSVDRQPEYVRARYVRQPRLHRNRDRHPVALQSAERPVMRLIVRAVRRGSDLCSGLRHSVAAGSNDPVHRHPAGSGVWRQEHSAACRCW